MGRTRADLHRLCAHVLGRRRAAVSGHFGLRAGADGIATPAFGPEPEVLRLTATRLIREVGTESQGLALQGATLEALARFAHADLGSSFSVGAEMPALGSTSDPLHLAPEGLEPIFDWFGLGWRVLDTVVADLPGTWTQSTVQLWPEHFDAGTDVRFGGRDVDGLTLGFSAGDSFSDEPYVYVSLWGDARPADAKFWNARFGAIAKRGEAGDAATCVAFLRTALDLAAPK